MAACLGLFFGLSACISTPAPRPTLAVLKVEAEPEQTRVYVDGRFAGRASVLRRVGKGLRPGRAFLTFTAPGYFPHDLLLELAGGETTVRVALRPIPQ